MGAYRAWTWRSERKNPQGKSLSFQRSLSGKKSNPGSKLSDPLVDKVRKRKSLHPLGLVCERLIPRGVEGGSKDLVEVPLNLQ